MSNEQLGLSAAITASFLSGIIIYAERAFPFLLFSKKEPPAFICIIEKYIPPMVMASLLFYCLKDTDFSSVSGFLPQLCALTLTILLHLWKDNALISIFSGTALYMILTNLHI